MVPMARSELIELFQTQPAPRGFLSLLSQQDVANLRSADPRLARPFIDSTVTSIKLPLSRLEDEKEARQQLNLFLRLLKNNQFPQLANLTIKASPNLITKTHLTNLSRIPLPNLLYLNLSGCGIDAEGAAALAKGASKWPLLGSIDLSSNRISDAGVKAFSEANFRNMQEVDFSNNGLTPVSGEYLATASEKWSRVHSLTLSGNALGATGTQALSKAKWPNLQILNLHGNQMGFLGAMGLAKATDNQQKTNPYAWQHVSILDIGGNALGGAGIEKFLLGDWSNVEMLNLSGNSIDEGGSKALASTLWRLFNLRKLNLDGTAPGVTGLRALFRKLDFVPENTRGSFDELEELSMCEVDIGPEGARYLHLCNKYRWLKKLKKLDVGNANMNDQAVKELLKDKKPNKYNDDDCAWLHLEELVFDGNPVSNQGAKYVANAARRLPCLQILRFVGCEVDVKGIEHVFKADWKNLEEVFVSLGPMDRDIKRELKKIKKKNPGIDLTTVEVAE